MSSDKQPDIKNISKIYRFNLSDSLSDKITRFAKIHELASFYI